MREDPAAHYDVADLPCAAWVDTYCRLFGPKTMQQEDAAGLRKRAAVLGGCGECVRAQGRVKARAQLRPLTALREKREERHRKTSRRFDRYDYDNQNDNDRYEGE